MTDAPFRIELAAAERFAADLDRLAPQGSRIGIAVSGGPDSVALLLLASAARPGAVEAATVDHGFRAESADEAKGEDETETAVTDPGEEAYSEGYHLWRDGKYDQSITALRAFVSGFPNHRRVSFARNLIGRALLDKGQPRPAAEALLANYRSNPKGERAPDSLYYLGQALMKLNQPGQACKAYAELEDVYGAAVRPDLQSLVTQGMADAGCS